MLARLALVALSGAGIFTAAVLLLAVHDSLGEHYRDRTAEALMALTAVVCGGNSFAVMWFLVTRPA